MTTTPSRRPRHPVLTALFLLPALGLAGPAARADQIVARITNISVPVDVVVNHTGSTVYVTSDATAAFPGGNPLTARLVKLDAERTDLSLPGGISRLAIRPAVPPLVPQDRLLQGIAASPDGRRVYVTSGFHRLDVIDTTLPDVP